MELKEALKDINVERVRQTNIFTKNMFGRLKTVAKTEAFTSNVCLELETGFLAVKIGIPNLSDLAQAGVKVSIGATAEFHAANYLNNKDPVGGGFWTDLTFDGGATSVTLPPRLGTERWSVTWSDTMFLQDIPRTDGSGRPLLLVRIEYPAGRTVSVPLNGSYYWRTGTAPRTMRASVQDVLGVSDKYAFTMMNTTDTDAVIPLVQYIGKRQGHQVMISGDSIQMGLGGTVRDYGAIHRVVLRNSTPDKPIEYFNAGMHAQTSDTYSKMAIDYLDIVQPTILTYSAYSVNDVPPGGLTPAIIRQSYGCLSRIIEHTDRMKFKPRILIPEGIPNNPGYKDMGAGDALRDQFNESLLAFSGIHVMTGYAAAISGEVDADGQTLMLAGTTGDNVHPNDTGFDLLASAAEPHILKFL